MEEIDVEIKGGNKEEIKIKNSQAQIVGAIILAGALIAGAILIKGNSAPAPTNTLGNNPVNITIAKIGPNDKTLGNPNAKITLVMYEDFQCPFCGKFVSEDEQQIRNTYVANGTVQFVYRDFAFLGPESIQSAEAARCAGDQGKFWDYHDYLFAHQNGENKGAFSDANLEVFAKTLGLDQTSFNQCLTSGKYAQAVADSKTEGATAGVQGTPKGFILKNGKVVSTVDGAEPLTMVTQKLDAALK